MDARDSTDDVSAGTKGGVDGAMLSGGGTKGRINQEFVVSKLQYCIPGGGYLKLAHLHGRGEVFEVESSKTGLVAFDEGALPLAQVDLVEQMTVC